MGTLFRPLVMAAILVCSLPSPSRAVVTLSGSIAFSSLDNGPLDEDPSAGVFAVSDSLVIEGTIECTDAPPLPGFASACPVHLVTGGDLVIAAGGAIVTENQRGAGNGGDVTLEAAGDVVLHGPTPSLPGARVSSARITMANPGGGQHGGTIDVQADGAVTLEAGSVISSAAAAGTAGAVTVLGGGTVRVDGFLGAGPTAVVDADPLVGAVLVTGGSPQRGGAISVLSASTTGPGLQVGSTGVVVSQGEDEGAGTVLLEACGVEVLGLVASITKGDQAAGIEVRSGEGAVVDGRDLGLPLGDPGFAGHLGALRVGGSLGGGLGHRIELFARGDVEILGPAPGSTDHFTLSAVPGTKPHSSGGTVTVLSTEGSLAAAGNAFLAGLSVPGNRGGSIDLAAAGDVVLDGAAVSAIGNFGGGAPGAGGAIFAQSFQGDLSWAGGTGDVRPTGSGVPVSDRGTIALVYCGSVDLTGSSFPTIGAAVPPFPEVFQSCAQPGPTLPPGASLPVCNQPPVAADDDFTTDEDSAVAGDVLADNGHGADVDPGGGPLTVTEVNGVAADVGNLVVLPSGALLTLNADGTFTCDPNGQFEELAPGEEDVDAFDYTIEEPGGLSDSATVTITITGVDDAPVAVDDTATVAEDDAATAIDVLANDTDVDGGLKEIQSVTQPANGTVVITGGGTGLTYEPDPDYCNDGSPTDDFTYTLNGGSSATVAVTVTCLDDDPVAVADAATVGEDSGANAIDVLGNDTDVDGGPKEVQSVTQPANGTVVITGGGTSVSYTPNVDYCNDGSPTDDFIYTLNGGSSAAVAVTVTCVDDPPVAVADAATVNEDSGANAIDVLANDTDVDGGLKTVQSVTQPANGTVAITGGGTGVSYTPNADYCNDGSPTDDFTYTLNGGSSATVAVTVVCINDPPVAADDVFDFVGNTELRVDLAAAATPHALETTGSGFGLLDNDADPVENDPVSVVAVVGCADVTAPFDCVIPGTGTLSLEADGRFSFVPAAGDADAGEAFQYTLSDGTDSVTATVTLNRHGRVWYVDNDTPTGGVDGTSVDPFDTLAEAQAASAANDSIFVHFGDGTTTGQDAGISLQDGQRLLGEHAGLSIPVSLNGNGSPTVLFAAVPGNRPALGDTVVGGPNGVSAVDTIPAEVAGLSLSGDVDALEWTTTGAFAGTGIFEIRDNVVTGAGAVGVDVDLSGTEATALSFHGNQLTATGTALDVQETGAGTLTLAAFHDNSVSGDTGGSGIVIGNAIFDAVPGGGFDTVSGGTTAIGAPGDGVGLAGLLMSGVSGDLVFTDLDIFADGGTGVGIAGTGQSNLAGGSGLRVRVGAGVGVVAATGGAAVDLSNLTAVFPLATITSTGSSTTGVSLSGVVDGGGSQALFTAGSASAITLPAAASGPAFSVSGGNARIAYAGTITNTSSGARAVSITTWAGDDASDDLVLSGAIDENGAGILVSGNGGSRAITFSGGLDIDTTSGEGFAATSNTNSLGLNVTGSSNDIDSVSATALRVTGTPIGSSNLSFRRISSGNDTAAADPANGIVVDGTGLLGGLKVTGSGGAGSGGTIQRTTGVGVLLASTAHVSFTSMNVTNAGEDGIRGQGVHNFELIGSNLTNNGNATAENGLQFGEASGSGAGVTGTLTITNTNITGSAGNNVHIRNTSGTLAAMNVSGGSFNDLNDVTGANSFLFEMSGTAVTTTATINGSAFHNNSPQQALGVQAHDSGTISVFTVSGASFNDNGIHASFAQAGNANLTFSMLNNTTMLNANPLHAINVFSSSTSTGGSITGTIEGNVIGNAAVASSGARGNGIRALIQGRTAAVLRISSNVLRQIWDPASGAHGIDLQFLGPTAGGHPITQSDVTVTNNDVNTMAPASSFPLAAIYLAADDQGSPARVRANVTGNMAVNSVGGGSYDYPTFDGNGAHLVFVEVGGSAEGQLVDTPPASANATSELTSSNTGTVFTQGITLIAGPINTP